MFRIPLPRLPLAALFLSAAHVGTLCAADNLRTYQDAEFGLVFSYPASWSEQPGLGRNTRVVITAPTGSKNPEANCNVIARRA